MPVRNLAFGALAFSAAASGQTLQPTGPWVVDVAANECLLIRPYGTPADPLFLAVSKAPMSEGSQLTLLYKRETRDLRTGTAKISFDGKPPIEARYSALLLKNGSKALKVETLRSVTVGQDVEYPEALAREAQAVSITVPKELSGTFALPDQTKALKRLNDCAMQLGVDWGYPVDEQKRLAHFSKHPGGLSRLFSGDDYPSDAHWRTEMGRVRVRIRIDDEGKPIDCTVLNSSGSASLDKATCNVILKRSRFDPAVDTNGKSVRSVYTTTVNWVLTG